MSVPVRPSRDLRLDILRGWLQISIFASHATGSLIGAWGIHAAWGLSDSSEQFVLLSGFTLGSVFTLKALRDGEGVAAGDLLRRAARLWRTHLVVFLMFGALVLWGEMRIPLPGEVDRLGWRLFADQPVAALAAGALLLYQPVFLDILPVFLFGMLLLPPFLWLFARWGMAAMALPLGLYAAAQAGFRLPQLRETGFEPLAWQLLFLLGAVFGRRALLAGAAIGRSRAGIALAAAILGFGLWHRLAQHGWAPGTPFDPALLEDKTFLGLPRLAHGLALAYLVAVLVPRNRPWMQGAAAQVMAAIGRHSLQVFCLGLFLSWGAATLFRLYPGAAWLDPLAIGAGVLALALFALALERRRFAPPAAAAAR